MDEKIRAVMPVHGLLNDSTIKESMASQTSDGRLSCPVINDSLARHAWWVSDDWVTAVVSASPAWTMNCLSSLFFFSKNYSLAEKEQTAVGLCDHDWGGMTMTMTWALTV